MMGDEKLKADREIVRQFLAGERNAVGDYWHPETAIQADRRVQSAAALARAEADAARLDYIERTFSGMTNRERYLPVQMIWGAGAMGRTLREACDKYMKRDALAQKDTP